MRDGDNAGIFVLPIYIYYIPLFGAGFALVEHVTVILCTVDGKQLAVKSLCAREKLSIRMNCWFLYVLRGANARILHCGRFVCASLRKSTLTHRSVGRWMSGFPFNETFLLFRHKSVVVVVVAARAHSIVHGVCIIPDTRNRTRK